jgi:protein-S-isoprenylcysteine O-methyltransferase Ste14
MNLSTQNLFRRWGFTSDSWKGQRGEYWVVAQFALLLGFGLVPAYPQGWSAAVPPIAVYGLRGLAAAIALGGLVLLGKGLIDLGQSLTPLPYPREDGELVQTGVYGLVRHSLYGGLILLTLGLSLWWFSLSHLAVTLGLALVLNAKASQEEVWLLERYPAYADYRQRVKKLVPWVY